jgi:pimeloyl-ACP methyl ester carboxylesterase
VTIVFRRYRSPVFPLYLPRRSAPGGSRVPKLVLSAATSLSVLALSALVARQLSKAAERAHPPAGSFLDVNGARVHYVEEGDGVPLLLLHGNGSMIEDFTSSGLFEIAAKRYRVIALDRPGFGHTSRPDEVRWTPERQADLVFAVLQKLGVSRALVLGHSWGASVALSLALQHPAAIRGLILASGYYYPSPRPDLALAAIPAIPFVGRLVAHSAAPVVSRLLWPFIMRKIFGPANTPSKFAAFPKELALRPKQLQAAADESAILLGNAFGDLPDYKRLPDNTFIVAGDSDRLIDAHEQSVRLHNAAPKSVLMLIPGAGHMVHQTHTRAVIKAIDEAAGRISPAPQP